MSFLIKKVNTSSAHEFESIVSRIDQDELRASEILVFKIRYSLMHELEENDHARKTITSRIKNKNTLLILYCNDICNHKMYWLESQLIRREKSNSILEKVRNADLNHVINNTHGSCMIEAPKNYHFILPSKQHSKQFLRVADAIQSFNSLDRITYWLMPILGKAKGVLIDNWSLSSVILHALGKLKIALPFDCLDSLSHSKTPESNYKKIAKLTNEVESEGKIVIVISVSNSGTLESNIRQHFKKLGIPNEIEVISIYKFSNSPKENISLCTLTDTISSDFYDSQNCPHCQKEEITISVDPTLFLVREFKEKGVVLRKECFNLSRTFVEKYDLDNVIFIHRDNPNDSRHHAFYVDIVNLLKDKSFLTEYTDYLNQLSQDHSPDILITPNHEAGILLTEIASKILVNAKVIVSENIERKNLSCDDIALIEDSKSILFIDDSVITGGRIQEFNRKLREEYTFTNCLDRVRFYVAVCRPQTKSHLKKLEVAITKNHTWKSSIDYTSLIFLPHWKSEQCPWCHEYDFLTKLSSKHPLPPSWLVNRVTVLSNRSRGINENPLLLLPNVESTVLGAESIAAPAGTKETNLIFSIAGALQELRDHDEDDKKLSPGFPYSQIFAQRNLVNFSEAMIRAVALRLVSPIEWGHNNADISYDYVIDEIKDHDQTFLTGELLLAIYRGDFSFNELDINQIYSNIITDTTQLEMIKKVLNGID